MLIFVESPTSTRQIVEVMSDAEYAEFQQALVHDPEVGDVIPGLGGLRKVRWRAQGRGVRSGARVIYMLLLERGVIFLLYVYTKGRMTDLNSGQKRRLRLAAERIKVEFGR